MTPVICRGCGRTFDRQQMAQRYCSPECHAAVRRARDAARVAERPLHTCVECGQACSGVGGGRYCGRACRKTAARKRKLRDRLAGGINPQQDIRRDSGLIERTTDKAMQMLSSENYRGHRDVIEEAQDVLLCEDLDARPPVPPQPCRLPAPPPSGFSAEAIEHERLSTIQGLAQMVVTSRRRERIRLFTDTATRSGSRAGLPPATRAASHAGG